MPPPIPQEVLDEIIDIIAGSLHVYIFEGHVSIRDGVLRDCSLVARAWTCRSQKHLFAYVSLMPGNIDSWCKMNAQNSGSLTRHVRRLVVEQWDRWDIPKFEPSTMEVARPYLSFPNLEVLTLSWWNNLGTFSLPRTFGHYSIPPLRSLTILGSTSNENDLLELVALFPSVDELVIDRAHVTDERTPKTFSFPDCIRWRTLRILPVDGSMSGVLDVIAGLHLQCQVLDISYNMLEDPGPITRLIRACSTTLKSMRLEQTNSEEPCDGITPHLLPELEELTLCSVFLYEDLEQPDALKLDVLGSLVCPKLRKIVITHTHPIMSDRAYYDFDTGDWPTIDGFLVRLAERSNSRLRVELRDPLPQSCILVFDDFLPAFREVGDFAIVPDREDKRGYRSFR